MEKFTPFSLMIAALMLSVLACSLPLIGDVEITEWYVSMEGSDSNSCTSESQACRTIQGALDKTGGADGIIHVAPGAYLENITINSSISIIGAGSEDTIVDGNATGTVFEVSGLDSEEEITVLISELTVQNGSTDGSGAGIRAVENVTLSVVNSVIRDNFAGDQGGGLLNINGLVSLSNVDVRSNRAFLCSILNRHEMDLFKTLVTENSTEGICNFEGSMTIRDSQLINNGSFGISNVGQLIVSRSEIAGNGNEYNTAGIVNFGTMNLNDTYIHSGIDGIINSCRATVVDTTVSGNSERGLFFYDPNISGAYYCNAEYPYLNLHNTTISGNDVGITVIAETNIHRNRIEHATIAFNRIGLSAGYAGDRYSAAAIVNSIIANNSETDCSPTTMFPGNGHNLDSDGTCDFSGSGHIHNADPRLEPLADNGGSTPTHGLTEGSPAIDSAFDSSCPPTDQRGVSRPVGGGCDIGAYEAQFELSAGTPEEEDVSEILETTVTPEEDAVEILEATVTPEPALPIAINFNADSYSILAGECTRLRWQVDNADQIALDGQEVLALEAEQICPKSTTTYRLTAENAGGQEEAFVTIEVTEPVVVPKAPAQLTITNQVCSAQSYTVTLGWIDAADNEDGYRIYRDGALIATIESNAKGFSDDPPYGGPYTYGVEAFNNTGPSSRPTVQEAGCIY